MIISYIIIWGERGGGDFAKFLFVWVINILNEHFYTRPSHFSSIQDIYMKKGTYLVYIVFTIIGMKKLSNDSSGQLFVTVIEKLRLKLNGNQFLVFICVNQML